MNKSFFLLSSLVVIALSGCGGKQAVKPAPKAALECAFPDSPDQPAPSWVCDAPVDGVSVSAVGLHEKSAAGIEFMKAQATAVARVKLAQQLNVRVDAMVKSYAETTGAASSETVDKVNTSVSKLVTSENIAGSKVFRSITNPKTGSIYVLVGLDDQATKNAATQALKTSMKNDSALWQQFKAQKGQDELAEAIANMKKE